MGVSSRAGAHTGVAIPRTFRTFEGDCHVAARWPAPRNDIETFGWRFRAGTRPAPTGHVSDHSRNAGQLVLRREQAPALRWVCLKIRGIATGTPPSGDDPRNDSIILHLALCIVHFIGSTGSRIPDSTSPRGRILEEAGDNSGKIRYDKSAAPDPRPDAARLKRFFQERVLC